MDDGKTFSDFHLPLPDIPDKDFYDIALTPTFEGSQGIFELRPIENRRARYLSEDGGRTWVFDRAYAPGRVDPTNP